MNLGIKKPVAWAALPVIAVIVLAAWWYLAKRGGDVHLSPWSEQAVPRATLAAEPIFLQTDARWANETTGGSGEPLSAVGCTICCLSMALGQHGIALDPSELNGKLKQADGFTERGWIRWEALEKITDRRVCVDLPRRPSHRVIEDALRAGCPVLVKVLLRPGVYHWVLVVGREEKEYLIKDPLGHGTSLDRLSSYGSDILAVRIVRKL